MRTRIALLSLASVVAAALGTAVPAAAVPSAPASMAAASLTCESTYGNNGTKLYMGCYLLGTKRAHASFDAAGTNETLYVRDEASDAKTVIAEIWGVSSGDRIKAVRDSGGSGGVSAEVPIANGTRYFMRVCLGVDETYCDFSPIGTA